MAGNFRIERQRNNDSLHLRLEGDFDDNSANELLKAIREKDTESKQVIVHTEQLKNILAFGRAIFQTNYLITSGSNRLVVFSGKNACQIAPAGVPVLND